MQLGKEKLMWDRISKEDPFWVILTNKEKKGKWKEDEFFETGKKEIDNLFIFLKKNRIKIKSERALDFGCGAGRLTIALTKYFKKVEGIDISDVMINLAKRHSAHLKNIKYKVNKEDNLRIYKEDWFSFIYSNLVLQHIKKKVSMNYISEFLRILKPKGIVIFQIPSKRVRRRYRDIFKKIGFIRWLYEKCYRTPFPMYCISKEEIVKTITKKGGKVVKIIQENKESNDFENYLYIIRKE